MKPTITVTVAVDSFKGSMRSMEAGNAVREGILCVKPDAEVAVFPVADGGEGTVEALSYGKSNQQRRDIQVTGPLGNSVEASYVTYDGANGRTAVIEIASAAGLTLVPEQKRNPMYTTTYGVGEMIRDAIMQGCRCFIIGLGGSATNDGGIGMLQALGYRFVDKYGEDVPFGARGLEMLSDIYLEDVMHELRNCTFRVVCDVKNPLLGEQGCSAVFAPQKGADEQMICKMEQGMNHYADLVEHIAACDESPIRAGRNREYPGAGAAGGLGYACMMFLNAQLERGVDIILNELGIEQYIIDSDYVITGEGKLDAQTIMGKAPAGVASLAKRHGKKVIAFAGCIGEGAYKCKESGLIDEYYAIAEPEDGCDSERELHDWLLSAMQKENAVRNLKNKTAEVFSEMDLF